MKVIALIAILGILALQATDAVPGASGGGAMLIGFVYLAAVLAVAIHEAWMAQRGVLGWIVNVLVAFISVMIAAPLGGAILGIALGPFSSGRSLAATGGPVLSIALAGGALIAILGAWAALTLVNRWR